MEKIIFQKTKPGRRAITFSATDIPVAADMPSNLMRTTDAQLPELSELDVVRHFTNLSKLNFSVDAQFYPLGSCTMKYNPKYTEKIASMPELVNLHPWLAQSSSSEQYVQGALSILYHMDKLLSEITGMSAFSMQPMAGAHGELTGVMIIAAYHRSQGNRKKYVIVPDSAHGTNPASAALAGYEVITIPSTAEGFMDLEKFKAALSDEVAAVMMTSPNTLGLFNPSIKQVADLAHAHGALMYYDGANLNAILGKCRPGDLGFDVIHVNLHKTFGTPHGAGGPGAGPVGVCARLQEFLPVPRIIKKENQSYALDSNYPYSIGPVSAFFGNFGVIVKAYAYILLLGKEGLIKVSEYAVLNANYIMYKLKDYYHLAFDRTCMHECVFSAKKQLAKGVHAMDIAKALIDRGIHPPTVYFPLIVKDAIMIEPTETESKETLDRFIETMIELAHLADTDPQALHSAPRTTIISRLDEVKAVKDLNICYQQTHHHASVDHVGVSEKAHSSS